MNPDSESPKPRSLQSSFKVLLRLLIILAVPSLIVFFIFPLVFNPRIDVPTRLQYAGSPSSVEFRISNQNLTPVTDLDYMCELSKLTLATGSAVQNANEVIRGNIRKIPGRHATVGRCEAGTIVTSPLKAAEYKLTIKYTAYPWRQQRSRVDHIAAQLNANGEVAGWKVN